MSVTATLLTPSPFIDSLPIWNTPPPIFTRKSSSPLLRFFKNLTPSINKVGVSVLWSLMVQKICNTTSTSALQMNIKLSHHVAIMWENCVIGNPPQLNPCEYGWERNEGEKPLRPTMLPAGIKIAPDEILQTTRCKCVSTQCNKNKCSCVTAGLNCSEFCNWHAHGW